MFNDTKEKKASMCFTKKMHLLKKLHSSMSNRAACEFNISESTIGNKVSKQKLPLNGLFNGWIKWCA